MIVCPEPDESSPVEDWVVVEVEEAAFGDFFAFDLGDEGSVGIVDVEGEVSGEEDEVVEAGEELGIGAVFGFEIGESVGMGLECKVTGLPFDQVIGFHSDLGIALGESTEPDKFFEGRGPDPVEIELSKFGLEFGFSELEISEGIFFPKCIGVSFVVQATVEWNTTNSAFFL